MKRFNRIAAVTGFGITAVLLALQYSVLIRSAPMLLQSGEMHIGGFRMMAWMNPAWTLPLVMLVLSGAIGTLANRSHEAVVHNQGTWTGFWTGVGGWLGGVVVFAVLFALIGSNPVVQEFVRASEPNPAARIAYAWIAPLAAATGALLGIIVGVYSFAAALIGGLIADVLFDRKAQSQTRSLSS